MPKTQWPTPAEVQAHLTLAGAWGDISDDLSSVIQGAIDATVRDFEDQTGWNPFLAAAADSTRYFDAPGPYSNGYLGRTGGGNKLELDGGLLSVTSLTVDGVTKMEGDDFQLRSPGGGWPNTKVLFLNGRVYSEPNGIVITGKWGFSTEIPANVWEAVRDKAAATMLGPLANLRRVTAEGAQNAQIKSKETGPVKTEYATSDASKTSDFSMLGRMWTSVYGLTAGQYLMV